MAGAGHLAAADQPRREGAAGRPCRRCRCPRREAAAVPPLRRPAAARPRWPGWPSPGPARAAARPPTTLPVLLDRLVERTLVRWDLDLPVRMTPRQVLAQRIAAIGDPERGKAARPPAWTGCAPPGTRSRRPATRTGCGGALAELDGEFTALTGRAPSQRAGQTYAGRALVLRGLRPRPRRRLRRVACWRGRPIRWTCCCRRPAGCAPRLARRTWPSCGSSTTELRRDAGDGEPWPTCGIWPRGRSSARASGRSTR